MKLTHKFATNIPDSIKEGVLYISIEYGTAIHKCCCGCGGEVVTPLSPAGWQLIFNGETVSLSPSIGNWGLPCKSHYWITNNEIKWAPKWSKKRIELNRYRDELDRKKHHKKKGFPFFGKS